MSARLPTPRLSRGKEHYDQVLAQGVAILDPCAMLGKMGVRVPTALKTAQLGDELGESLKRTMR